MIGDRDLRIENVTAFVRRTFRHLVDKLKSGIKDAGRTNWDEEERAWAQHYASLGKSDPESLKQNEILSMSHRIARDRIVNPYIPNVGFIYQLRNFEPEDLQETPQRN